jgi:hypothetical protein
VSGASAASTGGPSAPRTIGALHWQAPALALLLYAGQLPFYAGYVTDDTCIYARFARNLARHGELAFNPGEPSHAATSPLWALLGALGARCGLEPLAALDLLGRVVGACAVAGLAWLGARRLPGRGFALALAAVAATEPWLVRWSCSGLETPLAALLLVIAMQAALCAAPSVRWGLLGWALGIGPLVRPELALLAALAAVAALRDGTARRRPAFWVGLVAPLAAWAVFALPRFGHLWPATIQAKSTPLGLQPERLIANAWVMAKLIGVAAAVPTACVLWGAVQALAARSRRGPRADAVADPPFADRPWLLPVLAVWLPALPAVYLLRDVQVVSRYLEVVLPAVLLLGAEACAGSRRLRARWPRRLALAAWTTQALAMVLLTALVVSPSTRAFSRSLQAGLGDIARWLRDNTPAESTVAIYDIGLVGYVSDRRVLDLGGLVHPQINALRDRVDDREIVRGGYFLSYEVPDYLVDWDDRPQALVGVSWPGYEPVPLMSRTVANRGVSRPLPVEYTLYRIDPGP